MPKGVPTPAVKEAEFRAKYLELANARAAARAVGIPEQTGHVLAKRADADPEFRREKSELYARALEEVEALMLKVVRLSAQRCEREPVATPTGFFDNGPAYAKVIIDAHRSLTTHRKMMADSERPEVEPAQINVIIHEPKKSTAEMVTEIEEAVDGKEGCSRGLRNSTG